MEALAGALGCPKGLAGALRELMGALKEALGELSGSSWGALGALLGTSQEGRPFIFKNVWFFHWFYNKSGNLCYHGTGSEERAREAVRGQQKGMSMQEHCNVYDIGDRMQSKQ